MHHLLAQSVPQGNAASLLSLLACVPLAALGLALLVWGRSVLRAASALLAAALGLIVGALVGNMLGGGGASIIGALAGCAAGVGLVLLLSKIALAASAGVTAAITVLATGLWVLMPGALRTAGGLTGPVGPATARAVTVEPSSSLPAVDPRALLERLGGLPAEETQATKGDAASGIDPDVVVMPQDQSRPRNTLLGATITDDTGRTRIVIRGQEPPAGATPPPASNDATSGAEAGAEPSVARANASADVARAPARRASTSALQPPADDGGAGDLVVLGIASGVVGVLGAVASLLMPRAAVALIAASAGAMCMTVSLQEGLGAMRGAGMVSASLPAGAWWIICITLAAAGAAVQLRRVWQEDSQQQAIAAGERPVYSPLPMAPSAGVKPGEARPGAAAAGPNGTGAGAEGANEKSSSAQPAASTSAAA